MNRHKVFISYFHEDDQEFKDNLVKMEIYDKEHQKNIYVFDDYSVSNGDINDNLPAETIRKKIRDEFIKEATVLVLLCGKNTKGRKYIDWELHAAMYNTEKNPKMGIIVINLPNINQGVRVADCSEKELVSPKTKWESISDRNEIEECMPFLPSRIVDNLEKGIPITIVNWNRINNNHKILLKLIDNAYKRKDSLAYVNNAPLRKNNAKIKEANIW